MFTRYTTLSFLKPYGNVTSCLIESVGVSGKLQPLLTGTTLWNDVFAGVYFCRLAIFLCFAETNFCDFDRVVFVAGNYLLQFSLSFIYNAVNFRQKDRG